MNNSEGVINEMDSEEQLIEQDIKIASKLEDFTASPEFTDAVQTFMRENCDKVKEVKEGSEHSIESYLTYKKYVKIIENLLEGKIFIKREFLSNEKITTDRLFKSCFRVSQFDENILISLDYILACTEYEEFYQLMIDFQNVVNCNFEEGFDIDMLIKK